VDRWISAEGRPAGGSRLALAAARGGGTELAQPSPSPLLRRAALLLVHLVVATCELDAAALAKNQQLAIEGQLLTSRLPRS
jgi:hypothetical protein